MPFARLLSHIEHDGELQVKLQWKSLSNADDTSALLACVNEDVPQVL